MTILITGAFGFVGTNLSKALKSVFKCHLIASDIQQVKNQYFDEFISWNDLERIDQRNVDVIIHLAGKAHDTINTSAEQDYFDINVGLTKKIFQLFLERNATKFIFFSSVKAFADSVNGDSLTENVIPNPQTAYGNSNLEAERLLMARLQEYTSERKIGKVRTFSR